MKFINNIFSILALVSILNLHAMETTPTKGIEIPREKTLQEQLAMYQQTYNILNKKYYSLQDQIKSKYKNHATDHLQTAYNILTTLAKNLNGGNEYMGEESNYDPYADLRNAISNLGSVEQILTKQIRAKSAL